MIDSETGATAARHYRKPPALGAALGLLLASCSAASEINLPADGPDTHMMYYTLSTAPLQMFGASKVVPDARSAGYVKLNGRLDQRTLAELEGASDIDPAELAGRAMRGLAQAVRLGPPTQVMQARLLEQPESVLDYESANAHAARREASPTMPV